MLKDKDFAHEKLASMIEERGQKALKRFGQVAISGVTHSKLLSILGDVKAYWKDVYRPAFFKISNSINCHFFSLTCLMQSRN